MQGTKQVSGIVALAIVVAIMAPQPSQAVMPPDFIFNIGSQLVQFFSLAAIFLTTIFGVVMQFIRTYVLSPERRWIFFFGGLFVVVTAAAGSTLWYRQYAQEEAYQQWLAQSSANTAVAPLPIAQQLDKLPVTTAPETIPVPEKVFTAGVIDPTDLVQEFIFGYYQAIAEHRFADAYAWSKKSVDLETFKSWYTNVSRISVDNYTAINEATASIQLTLVEGKEVTRYGVLMTVMVDANKKPVRVASSDVRVLSTSSTTQPTSPSPEQPSTPAASLSFYDQHKNDSFTVTNDQFKQAIAKGPVFVLDARENIENEIGRYPGSTHIRFADLQAGEWISLPQDAVVYVFCWAGGRGEEVTRYLRTKKVIAQALDDGASGWVAAGGAWDGSLYFLNEFTDPAYKKLFTTADVVSMQKEGVIIVDSREPEKYLAKSIPGSVNIPLMHTSTAGIDKAMAQVPPNSRVITVCDEYVNCFDARLTGAELVRRGHTFLGRYNEPWKYGK